MPEKSGVGFSWATLAVVAVVAVAAIVIVRMLTQAGGPFTFQVNREGTFSITAEAGDTFADILAKAIAEDAAKGTRVVEAILSTHDYYSVGSIKLVDAIGKLGAAPEANEVTLGIRKLLWNLDGPFSKDTLSQADERFIRALEEIDRPVLEPGEKSRLIIELWQRGLERESPLGVRTFRASVVPVRPGDEPDGQLVFVCPGTGLGSKAVTVWNNNGGLITGVLAEDNRRLPCTDLSVALDRLFAGDPLTLGVDPELYRALADPDCSGDVEPQVAAFFEVAPSKLTAMISKPEEGRQSPCAR